MNLSTEIRSLLTKPQLLQLVQTLPSTPVSLQDNPVFPYRASAKVDSSSSFSFCGIAASSLYTFHSDSTFALYILLPSSDSTYAHLVKSLGTPRSSFSVMAFDSDVPSGCKWTISDVSVRLMTNKSYLDGSSIKDFMLVTISNLPVDKLYVTGMAETSMN